MIVMFFEQQLKGNFTTRNEESLFRLFFFFSSNEQASTTDKNNKGQPRAQRKRHITMGPSRRTNKIIINSKNYFFFFILDPALIEEEDSLPEPQGMLIVNNKTSLLPNTMHNDLRHFNANIKDDIFLSTSHATSAGLLGNLPYHNTYQSSQVLFYNPQSFSRMAAQSADTYFLASSVFARLQSRPKALTNPFAPASIRIPMVPGRRRWAHTFPIGL